MMNSGEVCSKDNTKSMCFIGNEYINKDEEFVNDFDNEMSVDCSDLSAKASSSSMQESMTNISNSHSTPDDNLSENALMSPITKCQTKFEDRNTLSPNQYYDKLGINNHSIDDTIESVLNKFRIENDFSSLNMPRNNSAIEQSLKSEPSNMNTQNYYPVNYSNGFNYRNYYQNRYYYPYSYNQQYRNFYQNYPYQNQFYYQNHSNYYMYQQRMPMKPNYEQYPMNVEEYPHSNFKIPPNTIQIEQSSNRKKRQSENKSSTQSKKRKIVQNNYEELLYKLKLTNFNSLITNPKIYPSNTLLAPKGFVENKRKSSKKCRKYKSIIYALKRKRHDEENDDKFLRKYIDDTCLSNKLLNSNQNQTENDNFLEIAPCSPTLDLSNECLLKNVSYNSSNHSTNRSPSPQLSKYTIPIKSKLPQQFRLPEIDKTANLSKIRQNNFKIPIISCTENETKIIKEQNEQIPPNYENGFFYSQLNGSFLKRTKINGKTFSNVHIEEAVNLTTIMNLKTVVCCCNCNSFLNSNIHSIQIKDFELGLESKNDKFSFCTEICLNEFKTKCKNPTEFDRQVYLNSNLLQQNQVILKNSQFSKQSVSKMSLKKVCDFEQYVRRRFPSENQNEQNHDLYSSSSFNLLPQTTVANTNTNANELKLKHVGSKFYFYNSEKLKPIVKSIGKEDHNYLLKKYSCYYLKDGLIDERKCILCLSKGDENENICGRLLNVDIDNWIHINCALWCFEVFETVGGCLMQVLPAIQKALKTNCSHCSKPGAGIQCFRNKCSAIYHVPCAHKIGCVFYTDRGMYCPPHAVLNHPMLLSTLFTADRRVIVFKDESMLVATTQSCHYGGPDDLTKPIFRTGALILNNIGQLLPEQLISGKFNSSSLIYPVGYHSTRIYWSFNTLNKRCRYECFIIEQNNEPLFKIKVFENNTEFVFQDNCCDKIWREILDKIAKLRKDAGLTKLFPAYLSGEQLYGLTEPQIIRVIESLPGVEMMKNYAFKFGKMQLITEMPLAVNPTGSARTEPKLRTYIRRTQDSTRLENNSCSNSTNVNKSSSGILKAKSNSYQNIALEMKLSSINSCSRIVQYKKMKCEWMDNVILSRSKIQGLGLFAARDLEKSTILIEYMGELIRNEVGNIRERMYEARNNSIYMFRLNEDIIIDATRKGGLARYINHSCNPNCFAELLQLECGERIVITTKQKISRGEELTYDYKFDFEEDNSSSKIPCLCGSVNCRKWMN